MHLAAGGARVKREAEYLELKDEGARIRFVDDGEERKKVPLEELVTPSHADLCANGLDCAALLPSQKTLYRLVQHSLQQRHASGAGCTVS